MQKGRERQWTFAQKQTGADKLTLGGCLSANVHGRGLKMPPFIGDVESFRLLTPKGEVVNCSRTENSELFRLAIGGYGLFGLITSATLRLVERRKLERVVEVRSIDGLQKAFNERIADGFLYGDFQYAIDEASEDFLRRGVFTCYRAVDPATPVPPGQKELRERDWIELLTLAHHAKGEAFRRYAGHYVATNGQVYWADEAQMSVYPENYHAALDKRVGAKVKATEAITEIYCERDALERFMAEVRDYARRDKVDIIYGTVRLIEQDRESFLAWARQAVRVRDLQRARRAHHERPDQGGRRVPPPDRHRPEVRRQLLPDLQPLRAAPPGRRLLPAAAGLPQAQAQVRPAEALPERVVPALRTDV